jgi:hypothetical protein
MMSGGGQDKKRAETCPVCGQPKKIIDISQRSFRTLCVSAIYFLDFRKK